MTYDTTVDTSRYQAAARTADAGWCTATYAAQLRAGKPRSAPGSEWDTWTAHHAYTAVDMMKSADAGIPPDTGTTAYRQWAVTVTVTGRDNWRGAPETYTAYASLTRAAAGAPWRVSALSLQ